MYMAPICIQVWSKDWAAWLFEELLLLTKSLYFNNVVLEKADCSAFLTALHNQHSGFDCMYLLPFVWVKLCNMPKG